jgi:hypothetical protein
MYNRWYDVATAMIDQQHKTIDKHQEQRQGQTLQAAHSAQTDRAAAVKRPQHHPHHEYGTVTVEPQSS